MTFRLLTGPGGPNFAIHNLQPPTRVRISPLDVLIVDGFTSVPLARISLRARVLTDAGQVDHLEYMFDVTGLALGVPTTFPLVSGYLLGLSVVFPPPVNVNVGSVWIRVGLGRGVTGTPLLT